MWFGKNAVDIKLCNLDLDFEHRLSSEIVSCSQFKGMNIARKQHIGTLLGLKNKLILCQSSNPEQRLVMIPEGDVTFNKLTLARAKHIDVDVDIVKAVRWHTYDIDENMRALRSNGSLQSNLYLAYLHAGSSLCAVDPFTQCTGTAQALSILTSSEVRSTQYLTAANVALMVKIANLSPSRFFKETDNTMIMQEWSQSLSPLSQDGGLHREVMNILRHFQELRFFYPKQYSDLPIFEDRIKQLEARVDSAILARDDIRLSTFRSHGVGGELHTTDSDAIYEAEAKGEKVTSGKKRQNGNDPLDASAAFQPGQNLDTLDRVYRVCWSANMRRLFIDDMPEKQKFLGAMRSLVTSKDGTCGPMTRLTISHFKYDIQWLSDPDILFANQWCPAHETLQHSGDSINKFDKLIWLSCLGFILKRQTDMPLLTAAVALVAFKDASAVTVPRHKTFYLLNTGSPNQRRVQTDLLSCCHLHLRRNSQTKTAMGSLASELFRDWKNKIFSLSIDIHYNQFMDVAVATEKIRNLFFKWKTNLDFKNYQERLYKPIKSNLSLGHTAIDCVIYDESLEPIADQQRWISSTDFFEFYNAPKLFSKQEVKVPEVVASMQKHATSPHLPLLLETIDNLAKSKPHLAYVNKLRESANALDRWLPPPRTLQVGQDFPDKCLKYVQTASTNFKHLLDQVISPLSISTTSLLGFAIAMETHYRPGLSLRICLEQLFHEKRSELSTQWFKVFVQLAQAFEILQHARRLVSAKRAEDDDAVLQELRTLEARSWDPLQHPDRLIFEIQNNIRIRNSQIQVANKMLNCRDNSVLQLNMGEGKTSVILPIVSMALANGTNLSRIITVKEQSTQTLQKLVTSLGGLLQRRVYFLPFSRQTELTTEACQALKSMFRQCIKRKDIILLIPEHHLSMELSAKSYQLGDASRKKVGEQLQKILDNLRNTSSDLVDESDETFSPKFELIYTIGTQQVIELAPTRWTVIQEALGILHQASEQVKFTDPKSVEMVQLSAEGFPRIRFLNEEASQKVVCLVATRICTDGISGLRFPRGDDKITGCLRNYILSESPDTDSRRVVEGKELHGTTKLVLLLLRGLCAHGILDFVFRCQRWRVNYGLDLSRDPRTDLAVPYMSKDIPKPRAEFSHPESIIVMTYLSYYYSGLSTQNLFHCLEHMQHSEDGDEEYNRWQHQFNELPEHCRVSGCHRSLKGINLKDRDKCIKELFPKLRFFKMCIDYFLSQIVYPKQMRNFPERLSASGWDIGTKKNNPITGFSGTKDSQILLPLSMKQLDLQEHAHTDALVLSNMLDENNSVVSLRKHSFPMVAQGRELLEKIVEVSGKARVIIELGALILDLTNEEAARALLKLKAHSTDISAVVFFNGHGEICVIDRQGTVELLRNSFYARRLDSCFVYLDEAHTRGTDLALPRDYQAVVTLGAGVTKDRLAQGKLKSLAELEYF